METLKNNSTKSLDELNYEETVRDIPLLIFLIILSLTGISGNGLVFYVFIKTYVISTFRIFVIFLSAVDLFTCTVAIPLDIATLIIEYKNVIWLCKLWTLFLSWPTITSVFLLLAIATDRYRKVCTPFSWQVSCRAARNSFICSAALSLAVSVLSPVLFGIRASTHTVYNVTIFECEVTDNMAKTPLPMINSTIVAILFIVAITGITILYGCIAVRVKQQLKRKHQMIGRVVNDKKEKEKADGYNTMDGKDKGYNQGINNGAASGSADQQQEKKQETSLKDENLEDNKRTAKSEFSNKNKQTSNNRTTLVMFLVSSVFFLSYVPSITLNMSRSFFIESLTDFERSVYKFVYRSYLLNCVINPFIYGIFDPHFRKSCKKICSCKRM